METTYSFARYEKKYLLTRTQRDALMARIGAQLKQDAYPVYTICSLYYDTDDYRLVRASLERPIYKEKLRVRSYGVPDTGDAVFVELKKKYDGVVYKRRVTAPLPQVAPFLAGRLADGAFGQIGREIDWFQRRNHTGNPFLRLHRSSLRCLFRQYNTPARDLQTEPKRNIIKGSTTSLCPRTSPDLFRQCCGLKNLKSTKDVCVFQILP